MNGERGACAADCFGYLRERRAFLDKAWINRPGQGEQPAAHCPEMVLSPTETFRSSEIQDGFDCDYELLALGLA